MEMNIFIAIAFAVALGLLVWVLTYFRYKSVLAQKQAQIEGAQAQIEGAQALLERERQLYSRTLEELKESQQKTIEAARMQISIENEKALKAREESLRKEAELTMKNITGSLDKDIREMKDAFDAQKKTHLQESSSIRTKFDEAVRNLKDQTESIGSQAAGLASAIRGQSKMQGIFGETILANILKGEGFTEGRDFDAEGYLRDSDGNIIRSEETGHRMRPDFILHYPDDTDILIDSKVSLTALADYFDAQTDEQRADAVRRNLQSVNEHVKELAGKEYQKFVVGRKTLDYVIMFIPNYGAYQLAKQEDPDIFSKAFSQNILITTEETLIPFLRLIRSAWVQKEQIDNMAEIIAGARKILDRVSIFCEHQAKAEIKVEQALTELKENGKRLREGRQSIAAAASEVVSMGVSPSAGKELPQILPD